jgi:hypothetical protein
MACITGCKLIVTKKIAIGNLRKIIVTLYYNLWSSDYLPYISGGYFLGNETIYGIKNTHIQQNRTDQPCG